MRSDHDDDDAADDVFRPVPLPQDRTWRHPSELANRAPGAAASAPVRPSFAARHPLLITLAAAVAGAAATTAIWFAVGADDPDSVHVKERVAMSPVVALDPEFVRADEWAAEVAGRVADSVVTLEIRRDRDVRSASAVVLTSDGQAVVPAHLVADAAEIVTVRDGSRVPVELVAVDTTTDVAVVRIKAAKLQPAVFTDDLAPNVGSRVLLVSAVARDAPQITEATVLSIDNQVTNLIDDSRQLLAFRLSRSFDASRDGGAVVDSRGAVIGIAATSGNGTQDGYVMPGGLVRAVASQLVKSHMADRPYLGVDVVSAGAASGVRVLSVADASPAALAGLQPDDVITAVDGEPVASMTALATVVRERGVGKHITIAYERADGSHQCTMTVVTA